MASKYAFGKELPSDDFTAVRARDYLSARGFTVKDRREGSLELIMNDDDESSFAEGKIKYQMHHSRERDSSITSKLKPKD